MSGGWLKYKRMAEKGVLGVERRRADDEMMTLKWHINPLCKWTLARHEAGTSCTVL